jgi:hypothetical protein
MRAVHQEITEPSSALSLSHSRPFPSHPLPSCPLRRAVHCELSIATSPSRPSLHHQAIFLELSIAIRPSLHLQAAIVHHELSIACHRPSRAVHRFIDKPTSALLLSRPSPSCPLQAIYCKPSSALLSSRPLQAVVHRKLSIAASPSPPLQHPRAVQRLIAEPSSALSQSCPLPNRTLPSRPFLAVQRFIAKPSIANRCPLQNVHRDNAKPSSALSPLSLLPIAQPSVALFITSQRQGTVHHPSTLNPLPNHLLSITFQNQP